MSIRVVVGARSAPAKNRPRMIEITPVEAVMVDRFFIVGPANVIVHEITIDGVSQTVGSINASVFDGTSEFSGMFQGKLARKITIIAERVNVRMRPTYRYARGRVPRLVFRALGDTTSRRGAITVAVTCLTFPNVRCVAG